MIQGVVAYPLAASQDSPRRLLLGPENALLIEVVDAFLAEAAETTLPWNPLVISGATGVGKSSVLDVLAAAIPAKRDLIRWSGTDWRRRFAAAVADDSVASWRGRCREVPCLLIDSLEGVIAAKQKAQEELATVLDYRRDHGLRTVLAADVHVLENRRLSERLRGRMAQGLIVQTAPPGRDVLRSLLRDLADQHQVPLSQEVSETLLRTLGNSVQRTGAVTPNRLRSTLARLKLLAGTSRRDPDAQLVRAATETRTDSTPINIPEIARVTAKHFGYRLTELKGPSRRRGVTLARACAISLARRLTGATLAEIGRHFGGRDHTTVLHSIKKIESQAQQNAALRITLEDLLRKLQSPLPCS